MDTVRRPFSDASRRAPPCNPATPFEKGVNPKTFLRTDNILFMEGQRIRNAGTMDFREPIYGPRSPSPLWVFCALVHCGRHPSESPWVFDDASLLHDLKRLCLFRRDEVPARNTNRQSGFAFTHLKKFLRVPRGGFSKTLLGRVWDSVPQRVRKPVRQGTPFQAGRSPCTKHQQIVRLCLYAPKKFLRDPRGVFSKTRPWQGAGQRPAKRGKASQRGTPFQAGESPCTKHPRLSGIAFTHLKSF